MFKKCLPLRHFLVVSREFMEKEKPAGIHRRVDAPEGRKEITDSAHKTE